jgi:hypothetical protein
LTHSRISGYQSASGTNVRDLPLRSTTTRHQRERSIEVQKQNPSRILKSYFEAEPHGRPVTLDEIRQLSPEDRHELARLAAQELGVELQLAA